MDNFNNVCDIFDSPGYRVVDAGKLADQYAAGIYKSHFGSYESSVLYYQYPSY
jgi:hypothetical protein